MKPAAFAEAIRRTVSPGAIVLDLGGDFAQRAVVACRSGAARVFSVQSVSSLPIARQIATGNSCAEQIEFVADASAESIGSRRVDVILADAGGGLPVYGRSLAGVARRIGSLDAIPIPRREHLFVAVANAPDAYARHVSPWKADMHGIDLGAARRRALNAWSRLADPPEDWLAGPEGWATIDYTDPTTQTRSLRTQVELTCTAAGLAHGIVVWSSIELADDLIQKHTAVLFPWPEPVVLSRNDRIALSLRADEIGGADVWSWTSRIGPAHGAGDPARRFEQSTFWSELRAPAVLKKAEAAYVPALGEEGRVVRSVLSMISDGARVGPMASTLALDFPRRFASPEAAEETIERLISTYSWTTERSVQS